MSVVERSVFYAVCILAGFAIGYFISVRKRGGGAMSDVCRETNNPQLRWKRVSDLHKVSECGRYIVERKQDYSQHPAMTYVYAAKRAHAQMAATLPLGTFESFDLAAAACERDLADQPQPKGN